MIQKNLDSKFLYERWVETGGPGFSVDEQDAFDELDGKFFDADELADAIDETLSWFERDFGARIVEDEELPCYTVIAFIKDGEDNCYSVYTRYPTGGGFQDLVNYGWDPINDDN